LKRLNLTSNVPESPPIEAKAARRAAEAIPGMPRDDNGPVFHAPWEAHAFAMALALHQNGLFAWSEWSAMLGEQIKKAQAAGDPDTGETYYHHWLATLERMVAEKGAATTQALAQHYRAWERATHRTPHGKPIELKEEDFRE
jgi:nitrile hydratase accessory protein